MRAVTGLVVVVAALVAGAGSLGGAAAAPHRVAKAGIEAAAFPSWSPDGKQIAFVHVRYRSSKSCCGFPPSLDPVRYRIVRRSSKPGGTVRTVLAARGWCCEQVLWAAAGRILVNPNVGLKSVRAQDGRTKRLVFPSCAGSPGSRGCSTVGFILSPNRRYAAAAVTTDPTDPHSSWGIGAVKLKRNGTPVVLRTPLAAEEDGPVTDRVLAFSPDSRKLVFSRSSWDGSTAGPATLGAIPLGGGDSVPLAQSGIPGASLVPSDVQQLEWSPDGRWIAYIENGSLEVVPAIGESAPRVLATNLTPYPYPFFDFAWSPTSKVIAYTCCSNQANQRLMTVHPDGTHPTNLLHARPLAFQGVTANAALALGAGLPPRWSPDGSRLLFTAHAIGHRTPHVWTIQANGHNLTRVG